MSSLEADCGAGHSGSLRSPLEAFYIPNEENLVSAIREIL